MKKQTIKEIKEALKSITEETDYIKRLREDDRAGVQTALKQWDRKQLKMKELENAYIYRHQYEKYYLDRGYQYIAGVDEVGRGPLAGPVVCAAVILNPNDPIIGLNDSKALSEKKRLKLYNEIYDKAIAVSVAQATPEQIDSLNIYQATRRAMKEAVMNLSPAADCILADAMTLDIDITQKSIVKGDSLSNSIAAASIIAKVTRDHLMRDYAKEYPQYDFENNVGYGTKKHLEGLKQAGLCPIHRKSFEPVKSMVAESLNLFDC